LLTHTSGLAYSFFAPPPLRQRYEEAGVASGLIETPGTIADNVRRLAAVPLANHPGDAWQYGLSTDVLGRVVEVVSGRTLDEFFRERIFMPLGMKDTHFVLPQEKLPRLAALYRPKEGSLERVGKGPQREGEVVYSATYADAGSGAYFSGGAGLVSTAADYTRFLRMLLGGGQLHGVRLLKGETVAEMTRNQIGPFEVPFAVHGNKFGLGFGVHTAESKSRHGASVGTYSWGGIFHTYFWVDPREELTGVLLTQLYPFGHLSLWADFQQQVYAALRAGASTGAAQNEVYEQYALTHPGDVQRGRALFLDPWRTRCGVCHKLDGQGGEAGPDLTHIGGKFDRPHLIESLLEPSRQIVEGYRTTTLSLADGTLRSGVIREQGPAQVTLLDAEGKKHLIAREQIDQSSPSPVSIMPDGLAKVLSIEDFTNLVAFLESLRPGGNKQGAGTAGPISIPDGFTVQTVATGLSGATALEVLPDGRVLVCEQTGAVRVVEHGRLLDEPLLTLPVEAWWERGVIGVTHHPGFPKEPFVYVCWVAKDPYPHHRVSRFVVQGNVADRDSELVLLVGDDQAKMGGKVPAGHQGGALHFGPDGKLYIGIGEQTAESPSQRLDTFLGKLLRINPDGSIPDDNPFAEEAKGKYRAIWARGCRNPFTFAIRPDDGLMLINDVGGQFEEINVGRPGANYGWPVVEHGDRKQYAEGPFQGPIHGYPQSSINGGDFCPRESNWPAAWQGRYLFADFVHGWVKSLDPAQPTDVTTFGSGFRRPVDLRFAPGGALYVLLRNAWVIDARFQPRTGSLLRIEYSRRAEASSSSPADRSPS
jgi:putative heme-binding domain-containing protein